MAHSLPSIFLLSILFLYACAADTVADINALRYTALQTANALYGSLNGTYTLDTSGYIARMASAVYIADTAFRYNNSTYGASNSSFDALYQDYLDEVRNLADACLRRGRLFHGERNLPVYEALQNLSTSVHGFGTSLTSKDWIRENSVIRTLTAGSEITNAQAAWANNGNLPGRKYVLWRRT